MKKRYLLAAASLLFPCVCSANSYYNHGSVPAYQGRIDSSEIRNEFDSIQDGFTDVETDINDEADTRYTQFTTLSESWYGFISLDGKYSCDIAAAISDIGSTPTNLVCDCVVTIASGTTATLDENTIWDARSGCTAQGVAGGDAEALVVAKRKDPGNLDWIGSDLTVTFGKSVASVSPLEWTANTTPGTTDLYSAYVAALASGPPVIIPWGESYLSQDLTLADYDNLKGPGPELATLTFPATATNGIYMNDADFCTFSGATIDMTTKGTNVGLLIHTGARNRAWNFRVVNASTGWKITEAAAANHAYGNRVYDFDVGACDTGFALTGADATHKVNGNQAWGGYVINYTASAIDLDFADGNDINGMILGSGGGAAGSRALSVTEAYGNIVDVAYAEGQASDYAVTIDGGAVDNIITFGKVGAAFVDSVEFGAANEQYRNTVTIEGKRYISSYSNGAAIYSQQAGIDARYTGFEDFFRIAHASSANQAFVRYYQTPAGPSQTLIAYNSDNVQIPSGSHIKLSIDSGIFFGSGSPEGAVSTATGIYIDLTGGAGTTLYVKEDGVDDATGWVGK